MSDFATFEIASSLLRYDPETGSMFWLVDRGGKASAGDRAGSETPGRHRTVRINGRRYQEHRVAWLLTHRSWPTGVIDHKNGCPTDNRLSNLRDVTQAVNLQNMRVAKACNTVGLLGVIQRGNRFIARIRVDGRQRHIGTFDDAESAHQAYVQQKRIHHVGGTI